MLWIDSSVIHNVKSGLSTRGMALRIKIANMSVINIRISSKADAMATDNTWGLASFGVLMKG